MLQIHVTGVTSALPQALRFHKIGRIWPHREPVDTCTFYAPDEDHTIACLLPSARHTTLIVRGARLLQTSMVAQNVLGLQIHLKSTLCLEASRRQGGPWRFTAADLGSWC